MIFFGVDNKIYSAQLNPQHTRCLDQYSWICSVPLFTLIAYFLFFCASYGCHIFLLQCFYFFSFCVFWWLTHFRFPLRIYLSLHSTFAEMNNWTTETHIYLCVYCHWLSVLLRLFPEQHLSVIHLHVDVKCLTGVCFYIFYPVDSVETVEMAYKHLQPRQVNTRQTNETNWKI